MGDYGKHQWKPGNDTKCDFCGVGVKDFAKPCTPAEPAPSPTPVGKGKADGKAT